MALRLRTRITQCGNDENMSPAVEARRTPVIRDRLVATHASGNKPSDFIPPSTPLRSRMIPNPLSHTSHLLSKPKICNEPLAMPLGGIAYPAFCNCSLDVWNHL